MKHPTLSFCYHDFSTNIVKMSDSELCQHSPSSTFIYQQHCVDAQKTLWERCNDVIYEPNSQYFENVLTTLPLSAVYTPVSYELYFSLLTPFLTKDMLFEEDIWVGSGLHFSGCGQLKNDWHAQMSWL